MCIKLHDIVFCSIIFNGQYFPEQTGNFNIIISHFFTSLCLVTVSLFCMKQLFNLSPKWYTFCLFPIMVFPGRKKHLTQWCLYPLMIGTSLRKRSYCSDFLFHSGIDPEQDVFCLHGNNWILIRCYLLLIVILLAQFCTHSVLRFEECILGYMYICFVFSI